jgi:type IX secretion system PorP/SprF family membrane protein
MLQFLSRYQHFFRSIFCLSFLFLACTDGARAQQDAQYTQYMYNTVSINPGYAGSRGHLSIAGLHRSQWVGLDGAPKTQTLNLHSPIGYRGVGLGFSVVNDQIGPTSETYFDADFSYTIQMSRESRLSFGLKASVHLLDIRFSDLTLDPNNPDFTLQQDIQNRLSPNVGAGIYYHTEQFYAGVSVPRFLETTHFDSSQLSTAREQMNFYFITGYVWDIHPLWKFKPTLLTKMTMGAPLQVDLSANFMYDERFIMGVAYRWDAAISGMVGFNISRAFMMGLAYDREVTELGGAAFNDGSFEVILRYDFISRSGRIKSPRFF